MKKRIVKAPNHEEPSTNHSSTNHLSDSILVHDDCDLQDYTSNNLVLKEKRLVLSNQEYFKDLSLSFYPKQPILNKHSEPVATHNFPLQITTPSKSDPFAKKNNNGFKVTPQQLHELSELIKDAQVDGSPDRSREGSPTTIKNLMNSKNKASASKQNIFNKSPKLEESSPKNSKNFQIRKTVIIKEGDKSPRSKIVQEGLSFKHSDLYDTSVIIHDTIEESDFTSMGKSIVSPFRTKKIVIPNRNKSKSPEPNESGIVNTKRPHPHVRDPRSPTLPQSKGSPLRTTGFHYDPNMPDRVLLVDYGLSPQNQATLLENKPVRPGNTKIENSPREKRYIPTERVSPYK